MAREAWLWWGRSWCGDWHVEWSPKRNGGLDATSKAFKACNLVLTEALSIYTCIQGIYLFIIPLPNLLVTNSMFFPHEVTIVICNYASPSLIREDVQSVSKRMVGQLMDSAPDETVAILVCPTFTYKSGALFAEEYALVKGFNDAGVHVDLQCQLVYDPKSKSETHLWIFDFERFVISVKCRF